MAGQLSAPYCSSGAQKQRARQGLGVRIIGQTKVLKVGAASRRWLTAPSHPPRIQSSYNVLSASSITRQEYRSRSREQVAVQFFSWRSCFVSCDAIVSTHSLCRAGRKVGPQRMQRCGRKGEARSLEPYLHTLMIRPFATRCATYGFQTLNTPNLPQDAKAGQLTKGGPLARRSLLVRYRKEAQVEGRAADYRSPVELSDDGLDYHAVDNPFVAGFGPSDARRRDAIGCRFRTLFEDKLCTIKVGTDSKYQQ